MTLADVLQQHLHREPDQTPETLFEGLTPQLKSMARNANTVATVLKRDADRFASADGVHWRLASMMDEAPTSGTAEVSPGTVEVDAAVSRARTLERELRDRLTGCHMVSEIGLDAKFAGEVREALAGVLTASSDVTSIGYRFPALFVTHLVLQGVYNYQGGGYWNSMTIQGLGQEAGPVFERLMPTLGLEGFEDIVLGDNALRYVAPILAHGGIPKYCLADYFNLLAKDLRQAQDAGDLLVLWRTRKSTFVGIDKPVRRFVLYGGTLAIDYVDRSIDLFREHARSGTVLNPDQVGLPKYVVTAFKKYIAGQPPVALATRRRARPTVSIDPWDGVGPVLDLPPMPSATERMTWRLQAAGQLERLPVSTHTTTAVRLAPSKSWSVDLVDGFDTIAAFTYEAFESVPAIFFDPSSGKMVSPAGGIRLDSVWVMTQEGSSIIGVSADGEESPARITEELPSLSGAWSGFTLAAIDVAGCRSLLFNEQGRIAGRVTVRSPADRPRLISEPVANVYAESGAPVFASPPRLVVPSTGNQSESSWKARLTVNGGPVELDDLSEYANEQGAELPLPQDRCSTVELTVRGPMGADLRTSFVVAPGLEVAAPSQLLFPGDDAAIIVSSLLLSVDGEPQGIPVSRTLGNDADSVQFVVGDEDRQRLDLVAQASRLLWTVDGLSEHQPEFGSRPVRFSASELRQADPPRLAVRTGFASHPLQLNLVSDGTTLQYSEKVKSGGREGRWVFDLGAFSDTIANCESTRLALELWVGQRPVGVATITPSFEVANLKARCELLGELVSIEIEFDEEHPMQNRVARLWSFDRPWQEPFVEQIAPDCGGRVLIMSDGEIAWGRYLVELAIDDGWTTPVRPRPGLDNTVRVTVGPTVQPQLDDADPFATLEAAMIKGYFATKLDPDDLATVMPAATEALILMLRGELLSDRGSMQFRALCGIALADRVQFARALLDHFQSGEVDAGDLLALAVAIGAQVQPSALLPGSVARQLWQVCPAIGAALDILDDLDPDRNDRVVEFTGCNLLEMESRIEPGEPVTQLYLGMPAEQLSSLQRSIELIPKDLLCIDSYVAANFEWLSADKRGEASAAKWWEKHAAVVVGADKRFPFAKVYLDARRPPEGTERWAALPLGTLTAALEIVSDGDDAELAMRALIDAMRFAPRMVRRDLVLARMLIVLGSRSTSEAAV